MFNFLLFKLHYPASSGERQEESYDLWYDGHFILRTLSNSISIHSESDYK